MRGKIIYITYINNALFGVYTTWGWLKKNNNDDNDNNKQVEEEKEKNN